MGGRLNQLDECTQAATYADLFSGFGEITTIGLCVHERYISKLSLVSDCSTTSQDCEYICSRKMACWIVEGYEVTGQVSAVAQHSSIRDPGRGVNKCFYISTL